MRFVLKFIGGNETSSCLALVVQSRCNRKPIESHLTTTMITQLTTFELNVELGMGCDTLWHHVDNI